MVFILACFSSLKEGDIYTDPTTGKQYRVRKTIMPDYSSAGPFGLGSFESYPPCRSLVLVQATLTIEL